MIELNSLVLGSQSPRRKDLLERVGLSFTCIAQEVEESFDPKLPIKEVPIFLAEKKARAILDKVEQNQLLLTADTIVCMQDKIFGKPESHAHAQEILKQLSGQVHQVITGFCLASHHGIHSFSETTEVSFQILEPDQIDHYIDQFKPFDKAGAYAIQEWIGMTGVKEIRGCYYNVVGLPIHRVLKEIQAIAPKIWPVWKN